MEPNQTPNTTPVAAPTPATPTIAPESKGGIGPIVGAVIIIALLIFGGLYFWGTQIEKEQTPETLPMILGDQPQVQAAPVQDNTALSPSDEPAAIEKDADDAYMAQLEADIDADLKAIEAY
ncbi:MAG: hypothetical protein KBE09_00430 [Candidatus Pacebacteria bacterium]|nr:hypothetical protein [Candidatus Paceibacterota bacterium]